MKRTITGLILISLFMGFILLTEVTHYVMDGLVLALIAVTAYEMITVMKSKGYKPSVIPITVLLVAIYPMMFFFDMRGFLMTAGFSFVLAFAFFIFDQKVSLTDFFVTVFIMIYPMLVLSLSFFLIKNYGMIPFLLPLAAAMCSDTMAYYFGSLIKGPKIFPKISPKKTYSGSIIGLIGGAVGALLLYAIFEVAGAPVYDIYLFGAALKHPIIFYVFTGIAIAVFSELGDLAASRVKRSLDVKDFSKIFGSHGGVMDRFDSILFALIFVSILMPLMPAMPV